MPPDGFPATNLITTRFVRPGDYAAKPDLSFGIVTKVDHYEEITTVSIEFLDGNRWLGDDDDVIAIARSRDEAAAWNDHRTRLDPGQLVELFQ